MKLYGYFVLFFTRNRSTWIGYYLKIINFMLDLKMCIYFSEKTEFNSIDTIFQYFHNSLKLHLDAEFNAFFIPA